MKLDTLFVYNNIIAGQTVELQFYAVQDMESFRVNLHNFKKRQEGKLIDLGYMTEAEVKSIAFNWVNRQACIGYEEFTDSNPILVNVFLKERVIRRGYAVRIITDEAELAAIHKKVNDV